MSKSMSEKYLEDLLNEWTKIKEQLSKLEEKQDKIKKLVGRMMDEEKETSFETDSYRVSRRTQTRKSVAQKDLPKDIWDKYSKETTFPVFTVKRF